MGLQHVLAYLMILVKNQVMPRAPGMKYFKCFAWKNIEKKKHSSGNRPRNDVYTNMNPFSSQAILDFPFEGRSCLFKNERNFPQSEVRSILSFR